MKKISCYCGSTIMGYRLVVTPGVLEAKFNGSQSITKPVSNNDRGVDYFQMLKLLQ